MHICLSSPIFLCRPKRLHGRECLHGPGGSSHRDDVWHVGGHVYVFLANEWTQERTLQTPRTAWQWLQQQIIIWIFKKITDESIVAIYVPGTWLNFIEHVWQLSLSEFRKYLEEAIRPLSLFCLIVFPWMLMRQIFSYAPKFMDPMSRLWCFNMPLCSTTEMCLQFNWHLAIFYTLNRLYLGLGGDV